MLLTGYHNLLRVSIPILCGGGRPSWQPVRQIRGCAAQGLEERKGEPAAETLQEGAIYPGQERFFGGGHVLQDPEPQGFMRKEQVLPAPQHQEDEP